MRILYFSRDYTPHDYRFLTSLAQAGQEVHYLRLGNGMRPFEGRQLPGEVHQLSLSRSSHLHPFSRFLSNRKKLTRVLEEIQPDLVHAGPIQQPAFLAAAAGFHPLISMSWGSDMLVDAERNCTMSMITRYTLRHSDLLFCDCLAVQEKAAQFGHPKEKVVVFPWGINLGDFTPGEEGGLRSRLGWKKNWEFVLLSVRSWEPIYGVDVVVKGFCLAAKKLPNLRLVLLGEGSQGEILKDMLRREGLLDKVHLGGRVCYEELPQYYRAADLYISASHSDGSSVSLMESLASGTPVLVSSIPGNLEWVEPGKQGWIFSDGDASELAERLHWAESHPQDLRTMSKVARQRAEEKADWNRNFERMMEGYRKVAGKK